MATKQTQTTPAAAGSAAGAKGDGDIGKFVKGVRVVARSDGFRRIGRSFGADPVEIALSDLTDEELQRLRAERELLVVDVAIEVPEATEAAGMAAAQETAQ
jgi:hypothetical protein